MPSDMSVKDGSRILCHCSTTVLVISGFPLDFLGGKEKK